MKTYWYCVKCDTRNVQSVIRRLNQLGMPASTNNSSVDRGIYAVRTLRVWTCSSSERHVTAMSLMFDDNETPVSVFKTLEDAWGAYPWDLGAFQDLGMPKKFTTI